MGISVNFTRTLAVFRRRSQRASGGAQSALSAILAAAAAYDGTAHGAQRLKSACDLSGCRSGTNDDNAS